MRHLRHSGCAGPTGESRSVERLQIRLARDGLVERLEPARGGEQQRRCLTAMARGERDLGAQQVDPRERQRFERRFLGRGEQHERRVERAGS